MPRHFLFIGCVFAFFPSVLKAQERERPKLPNIVWITSEDHGPHMGCYGDKFARTPNVDKLAKKGMIFTHAWSNAPVCAPARTTIISGLYATSTGAEHMRSLTRLPPSIHMFLHYMRLVGYYCTNHIKEDYNLEKVGKVWDESSKKGHWRNRGAGQAFFAVFNSLKSHESQLRNSKVKILSDPRKVRVPAYHPDTPEVREDWTRYYETIALADADAGDILRELEADGLLEDTIIFYFADHGSGMPRNKRTPLNGGLQVPLIVYFPPAWQHLAPPGYTAGGRSNRLVSFVDLAPTMLSLAGVEPPEWMQGRAFAGKYLAKAPEFLHGFRGRMDERYDLQRSVSDGRFVYLRNYLPQLSAGQHVEYMFETKTTRVWKKLFDAGKLNDAQSQFWQVPRPPEELYDLSADPDEIHNLAFDPAQRAQLERLRQAQREQALKVRDVGFLPEDEIHRRAAGVTPYEMGHDRKKYPLERLLDQADAASSLSGQALPKLHAGLKDNDNAIRYWSALGILIRGQDAVAEQTASLTELLQDESRPVRVVAAEALAQFGTKDNLKEALPVLLDVAHPKKNSIYNSLAALNALDRLGDKARPAAAEIRALPTQGVPANHRAAPGIERLLVKINEQLRPR